MCEISRIWDRIKTRVGGQRGVREGQLTLSPPSPLICWSLPPPESGHGWWVERALQSPEAPQWAPRTEPRRWLWWPPVRVPARSKRCQQKPRDLQLSGPLIIPQREDTRAVGVPVTLCIWKRWTHVSKYKNRHHSWLRTRGTKSRRDVKLKRCHYHGTSVSRI